jgi:hypothetical protein
MCSDSTLQQVHPDDRAEYKDHIGTLNITKSFDINYRIIRNDGEFRHLPRN